MLTPDDVIKSYDPINPPQTNLERWLLYMQSVESPSSFILFGLYSAISAALQRRVWNQHGNVRCFPNMFIGLVGKASLGKGRVICPLKMLFDGHRYDGIYDTNSVVPRKDGDVQLEPLEAEGKKDKSSFEEDLLFPIPSDSGSLRGLTHYMAANGRACFYVDALTKKKRPYYHASCYLILEDIVSLLKSSKETKNMVDFLVQVWDAGNYKHMTFGYGIDMIRNSCVSMLFGVTPDSMEDLFNDNLLREGISSRTIFLFEDETRFRQWPTGGIRPEQLQAMAELREHIYRLSRICGEVTFTDAATQCLKTWYENDFEADRINYNPKLDSYYGRKKVHVIKLAIIIHFLESCTMTVDIHEVTMAMELLKALEANMHKALRVRGRNELSPLGRKVIKYIRGIGTISTVKLWTEFIDDFKTFEELKATLEGLKLMNQLEKLSGDKWKTV